MAKKTLCDYCGKEFEWGMQDGVFATVCEDVARRTKDGEACEVPMFEVRSKYVRLDRHGCVMGHTATTERDDVCPDCVVDFLFGDEEGVWLKKLPKNIRKTKCGKKGD